MRYAKVRAEKKLSFLFNFEHYFLMFDYEVECGDLMDEKKLGSVFSQQFSFHIANYEVI